MGLLAGGLSEVGMTAEDGADEGLSGGMLDDSEIVLCTRVLQSRSILMRRLPYGSDGEGDVGSEDGSVGSVGWVGTLLVRVAVPIVLIHTGALVTVRVMPGVTVTMVFERIEVWTSMGWR